MFVFLDCFEFQRCFVDIKAKFYLREVFFMERWPFSLQDPILLVFFGFSEACLS